MTELNQQNSLLGKIAAYTEILAKDPNSTIFVSLSEAYRKMGMLDDARLVIEKGLERHSDFSPAYIVLARILCQQGEYAASETAFQKSLKFDNDSLAALVGYSRLCILLGQEEKARELLLKARTLSPADPVINKLLLSLPQNNTEPAVEEELTTAPAELSPEVDDSISPDEVKEDTAPPLASSTLAELYFKQGLTQQAIDVYRQLSADEPDNLLYRRKIRDLEEGGSAEDDSILDNLKEDVTGSVDEQSTAMLSEAAVPADAVEKAFAHKANDSAELSTASSAEPCGEISADEKVIETLNKWLDSIQQRRRDV